MPAQRNFQASVSVLRVMFLLLGVLVPKRIDVEFLPNDAAGATFVRQGAHSTEIFGWRGHIADLKAFIEKNDMLGCIQTTLPYGISESP